MLANNTVSQFGNNTGSLIPVLPEPDFFFLESSLIASKALQQPWLC